MGSACFWESGLPPFSSPCVVRSLEMGKETESYLGGPFICNVAPTHSSPLISTEHQLRPWPWACSQRSEGQALPTPPLSQRNQVPDITLTCSRCRFQQREELRLQTRSF